MTSTKLLTLTKEAQRALMENPTDETLIKLVTTEQTASPRLARWMAVQILGTYGYKFTTKKTDPAVN